MSGPKPIPFSRPCLGPEEEAEVLEVLRSGWVTSGPKTEAFEQAFAAYVGAAHAVALSSCTAALHLALLSLGVGPGDEVITTPMTWASTVNMIVAVGATPVFADIDLATLNLSVEEVANAVSPRTKAVIPVHMAGYPCPMEELGTLANENGLLILEDAAHAVGTEIGRWRIGALSPATCFSFHPIKNMTTGEGGMITTNDGDLADRLRLWRFHGISRDAWRRYGSQALPHYVIEFPGFKYNMTDLQAALGLCQLKKLDRFIEVRTRQARRYEEEFQGLAGVGLPREAPNGSRHSWNLYIMRIRRNELRIDRNQFMDELKVRGILTGLHFTAVHLHPYYRDRFGGGEGQCPHAEQASDEVLSLPLYPGLSDNEQATVIRAVRDIALAHTM